MEYVLYNGMCYCGISPSGKIIKSTELDQAHRFSSASRAKEKKGKLPTKLASYHVYGIAEDGNPVKLSRRNNRIRFTREQRIEIYNRYDGYCNLCGRKLDFSEMTIDHIVPLDKGGLNDMENLQCSCEVCNGIKQNILPQDFMEKISCIYLYQAEKRIGKNSLRWKVIKRLMQSPTGIKETKDRSTDEE